MRTLEIKYPETIPAERVSRGRLLEYWLLAPDGERQRSEGRGRLAEGRGVIGLCIPMLRMPDGA